MNKNFNGNIKEMVNIIVTAINNKNNFVDEDNFSNYEEVMESIEDQERWNQKKCEDCKYLLEKIKIIDTDVSRIYNDRKDLEVRLLDIERINSELQEKL